jgi:hypothetical protein
MSRSQKLQRSLAAFIFFAALGIGVESSHAAQIQRESMLARSTVSERATTFSRQRGTSAIYNSIEARKKIAAGISPDG